MGALSGMLRARYGETVPPPTDPLFVFHGERLDIDRFRKGPWRIALAKANIGYRKPYALRHTFATLRLSQGQSVKYVAAQLGHTSAMTTFTHYARWMPAERIEAPGRLEAQLSAGRSAEPANFGTNSEQRPPFMQRHATDEAE